MKDDNYISTSNLARLVNIPRDELFELLNDHNWIRKQNSRWILLDKGIDEGGTYKSNEKGEKWIVWPTSIIDNSSFKTEMSIDIHLVKRKFQLPGEDDLNKDQDRVLELPENGQYLIIGGPGTGKSVVALLRAMQYHNNNDYVFLTFNKVLKSATSQLVNLNLNSNTFDTWFNKEYKNVFKEPLYKYNASNTDTDYQKPDYPQIIQMTKERDIAQKSLHIIIDEGQDKPTNFYETLAYFGFENFFIVADQNQQITEDYSSVKALRNFLGLRKLPKHKPEDKQRYENLIELKQNFRNSYPVALFSHSFYTDPSSPPPNVPPKSRTSLGLPILYKFVDANDCIKLILREADRDSRNLIGIVTANNKKRDWYATTLKTKKISLDNPRPRISTYSSEDKRMPNINYGYGGIVVLNDRSVKGLEFDIVYIILDGFKIYSNDIVSMKKRFYVMSSRAIKKLVLLKSKDYCGGVDQILPIDTNILKIETL